MQITIRGEKVEITASMKKYAEDKLQKLDKYIENTDNVTANILVKLRNYKQKVEVTIPLKSVILRTEESQDDFYAAIDNSIDKLERQIRKNKTRLETKQKNVKDFILDYDDEGFEENSDTVVKRKLIEVKPMSEEEAILQMELSGHQFYLYKDAETSKATVIYKRKDGDYGLIESE